MCKFCERAGVTVKKITSVKYEERRKEFDHWFGKVQIGETVNYRQPLMKLETTGGTWQFPMPVEFLYCPHCGRKIKEDN